MIKTILIKIIQGILWLIDKDHRSKENIGMDDIRKFTNVYDVNFQSDFGRVSKLFRTIPYEVWKLETETHILYAADRHRVIDENHDAKWLEDLMPGDKIKTDTGIEEVIWSGPLGIRTHMYCMEVHTDDENDPNNHLYYSNGILSHNTICSAAYILWKAMFTPDCTVLITANKFNQAMEVMDRIRFMYENMEWANYIRAGIEEYNKGTIHFDNGSRIIARATTADAGRGLAVSLLYCLDGESMVTVRNKETGEIKDISLLELYQEMNDTK